MISSPPATRSILYLDCRHLTVCILGAEKTAVGVFCPDEGLARARARCSGLSRSGLAHPGASPRSLILYSCAPRVDRLYYHTARFWSLRQARDFKSGHVDSAQAKHDNTREQSAASKAEKVL